MGKCRYKNEGDVRMNKKIISLCLVSVSLMILLMGCKPSDELPPGPEDLGTTDSAPLGMATGYQQAVSKISSCYPAAAARPAGEVPNAFVVESPDDNPSTPQVEIDFQGAEEKSVTLKVADSSYIWAQSKLKSGSAWQRFDLPDPRAGKEGNPVELHSRNNYGGAGCLTTDTRSFESGTLCWAVGDIKEITIPYIVRKADLQDCTLPDGTIVQKRNRLLHIPQQQQTCENGLSSLLQKRQQLLHQVKKQLEKHVPSRMTVKVVIVLIAFVLKMLVAVAEMFHNPLAWEIAVQHYHVKQD